MPTDTRQRVPQSGASAAGVSTGMRALKRLSSTRNTQLPPQPLLSLSSSSLVQIFSERLDVVSYFWFHVCLKCFFK